MSDKSLTEKIDELIEQIKALCEEEGYTFQGPYVGSLSGIVDGSEVSLSLNVWEPSRDWQDSTC